MLFVVVDTSTPAITAALAEVTDAPLPAGPVGTVAAGRGGTGGPPGSPAPPPPAGTGRVEVLAERVTVDARAHGELLGPQVDAVLRAAGVRPGAVCAVVAGLGPGPFTGLRVGLVTAAALGQVLDVPTYGVCSLDALGLAAGADPVLVATDARRHEVYWAAYSGGVRLAGPGVARPGDVPVPEGVRAAVGDGALRYAGTLRDAAGRALPVRDTPRYPPARELAALAAGRVARAEPGEPLVPLYLRRPDAVEPGARKPVLP